MSGFRLLAAIVLFATVTAKGQDATFRAVDLFVDSGSQPLAAYQLSFHCSDANVKIVGVEGGEHSAFAEPPYYDPQAMQTNRVVIAAFSTGASDQLPRGRTRVATIHVQIPSRTTPQFQLKVEVSATALAERINVSAEAKEMTPYD